MDAKLLKEMLAVWSEQHCGHEDRSAYLGMSGIARCPRVLYYGMTIPGRPPLGDTALRLLAGNEWERLIIARLTAMQVLDTDRSLEVVARFDSRFRGHLDAVIKDGTLLEIKSTVQEDLERIVTQRSPKSHHLKQVSMYLEHGNFARGIILYVARDTGHLFALNVPRIENLIQQLNDKARRVLAAVDACVPPACECGQCDVTRNPMPRRTEPIKVESANGIYTVPSYKP
jgi:hypothetical protein